MKHIIFAEHPKSKSMLCVPTQDYTALFTIWLNDEEVRKYLLRFAPVMPDDERDYLAQLAAGTARRGTITDVMFLIIAKDKNKPIGTIGLHQIDWKNRHALTGTLLGEKSLWSHGYGTDAKMLLLNWAFNELGLNSIESHVIDFNERSKAYSKKCGYKEVGRMRERHFRNGRWYDDVVLDVLAKEWHPLWKKFEEGKFHTKERPLREPRRIGDFSR